MGFYSEYLEKQMSYDDLVKERKLQLYKISRIRKRDILVYASDPNKGGVSALDYSDILPFSDQLFTLKGTEIDIILETPGGIAEVVEDLVGLIRSKYPKVGIIVPGSAKSAGTIFTMAADEILMGPQSALGPIDAQIMSNGKTYSADAFLEGLRKIKDEVNANNKLDLAYIPILQNISPGEIQHCENAQNFSKALVTNWLKEYKFKFWNEHTSTGEVVTAEEKSKRAKEIASTLCNHGLWLTHGRSIHMSELQNMKLIITDYSVNKELNEAITRYYTLLKMSFETNLYKIYETPNSQIYRSVNNNPVNKVDLQQLPNPLIVDMECGKCKAKHKVQINFDVQFPIADGVIQFPSNNRYKCPSCGSESDVLNLRQQLESQTKKKIV